MLQFEFSRDALAYRVLWVLAFCFPVGMGAVPHWTSTVFYLFSFFSVIYLGEKWYFPDKISRYLFVAFVIFFLASTLSLINAENIGSGIRRLEKLLFLFCFFPSYFAVQRMKLNLSNPFLFGIFVTGIVFAIVSIYSVYFTDMVRAQAAYSPIIFGDMTMLVSLFLIAAYFAGWVPDRYKIFCLISVLSSLYAAVLSGSRGAWISLPIVAILFFWILRKRITWVKIVLTSLLLFLVIIFSFFNDRINMRVVKSGKNIERFVTGDEKVTSESARLMMWQIALSIWIKNPVLGTGVGDYQHEIKKLIDEKQTKLKKVYGHAHNIFLDALATTGLLGFSALVGAFFIVPGHFFLSFGFESTRKKTDLPVLAGLTHLVCFAVFGLTEGWLARSPMVSVFLFGLLVFISSAALGGNDA